ncbi:MAG: 30S ribosomal protein S6, partial [Peptostreptococcus sp.]|nr:30S ribosomal protein S6 [Peptostreptococcus sp.]
IEKFRDGVYTLVNFKADVEFPKELDRRLKISEDVIRHVIVAQEEN